jgi:hypothetical protein
MGLLRRDIRSALRDNFANGAILRHISSACSLFRRRLSHEKPFYQRLCIVLLMYIQSTKQTRKSERFNIAQ